MFDVGIILIDNNTGTDNSGVAILASGSLWSDVGCLRIVRQQTCLNLTDSLIGKR